MLAEQDGIATREQLLASGVTDSEIAANLAGLRWRRLNEHVIATHNGPLTRRQAMWAVVLSAPGRVVLCSETVCELFDGQLVLRYASISIYTDDPDAVRQIGQALAA